MSINGVDCSGCAACYIICPFDAIKMSFDNEGFYKAVVEKSKCNECGLCSKVCSSCATSIPEISKSAVFIGAAKDKTILMKSSSGGAAYILAKKALSIGLPVCGVTYDKESECAKHIIVNDESELEAIQGSKYLQSVCGDAFKEIVSKQKKGVVFGTPCQIAGMDSVLKKYNLRDDFILVDIFCHGTPSQLLWKNHLAYLKNKGKINESEPAVFREKKNYKLSIGTYKAWYNQDAFYTFFLRGWLKNHKCYFCNYRRNGRSDLRIGDCMAEKYKGLSFSPSAIIANTKKGYSFLMECKDDLELYCEDYLVIDRIQEKENLPIPHKYRNMIESLQSGEYPENIIKKTMIFGRFKAMLKRILNFFAPKLHDDFEMK